MRVDCTGNRGLHLPPDVLALAGHGTIETDYGTTVGNTYVVYAMSALSGQSVAYCLGPGPLYSVPAELFTIIDGRLSRHWSFNQLRWEIGGGSSRSLYLWGYSEFVMSDQHRLDIVEGEAAASEIFGRYALMMDLEFAPPIVSCTSSPLEGRWVQCGACGDAWQPHNDLDELVRCPACSTVQRRG